MTTKIDSLVKQFSQDNSHKYYVYRLVDPRTFQTFYVGKGCGDRVLQHVKDTKKLLAGGTDEDEMSLKCKTISDILASGKEVISIIHRRGLTEHEAFEVEAALIDAYPGLSNDVKGHGFERGAISLGDLEALLDRVEYSEPEDDYVIIKTSYNALAEHGYSLYDATRMSWRASLKSAKRYQYAFSVINGAVQEVYKVSKWYQYSDTRIAFEGEPATDHMASYKGKLIPAKYRARGASNPFLFKKK